MNEYNNILSDYPDVLLPEDLMTILKIGRNTTYKILKEGIIKSIKVGRNYKIPKLFIIEYLFNNVEICL